MSLVDKSESQGVLAAKMYGIIVRQGEGVVSEESAQAICAGLKVLREGHYATENVTQYYFDFLTNAVLFPSSDVDGEETTLLDRKSTRLNSSHT